jgi:surface antigen
MKRWLPALGIITPAAVMACVLLPGCSSGHTPGLALARPTLELATPWLMAGHSGVLAIDSHDASACALLFAGPGGLRSGPFSISLRRPHLEWRWRVPSAVTRGTWTAHMTCTRGDRQSPALVQQLTVRPSASADSHTRAGSSTVMLTADVQPGAGIVAPGSMRASTAATSPAGQASPTGGQVSTTAVATQHFELGQCTWWADMKRPDIFLAAVAHGVPTGSASPPYPWDAWKWAQNARTGGLRTGSMPQVGAIAVYPRGSWHSSVGHVAYVESVSQDSYVISEENFGVGEYVGGGPDGDDPDPRLRTIYTSGHANDPNLNPPGTEFIYRTSTPGPTPPAPSPTATAPLPGFYYETIWAPQKIYLNPAYPKRMGIDNHDWITIQRVGTWLPDRMVMAGTLNYDNCQPDCASGQELTLPVRVLAKAPQRCAVQIGPTGSTSSEVANVYSQITVEAVSGHPPSSLLGSSVFKVCDPGNPVPTDRVTIDGYGRLNLGMTLAEATAAVGPIQLTYNPPSCGDGQMPGAPNGVTVMFLQGRLARIDIGAPSVLTLSGIGVGSSADDVTRTYPGRITIHPAPNVANASWYVYTAKDPALSGREIVFWISRQKVTHYQVGFTNAAELVEGCLSA